METTHIDAGPACKPNSVEKPDPNHATVARRHFRDLKDDLHETNRKNQGHEPQGGLYTKEEENCTPIVLIFEFRCLKNARQG